MRRKLATPDTWNILAAVIAIGITVVGATWFWNSRNSTSQEAFVVKQADGKVLVTTAEWATAQANNATIAKQFPGQKVTLDAMVEQKLSYAEAERRGTVCSNEEAAARLKEADASLLPDHADVLLYNAESSGIAPVGYSLTPEAQRTPTTAGVIALLEADPAYIDGYRKGCSIGRLYDSLVTDGDNQKRNDAISALKSDLRNGAGLEYGSAATPEAQ